MSKKNKKKHHNITFLAHKNVINGSMAVVIYHTLRNAVT